MGDARAGEERAGEERLRTSTVASRRGAAVAVWYLRAVTFLNFLSAVWVSLGQDLRRRTRSLCEFSLHIGAQLEDLVLLIEIEFAFVVDAGLQHAAHGDLRFVKDAGAKTVQ